MAKQNLVGKTVKVVGRNTWHYGDWGVVQYEDEDGAVGVAMFGDTNDCPIFERKELRVIKEVR